MKNLTLMMMLAFSVMFLSTFEKAQALNSTDSTNYVEFAETTGGIKLGQTSTSKVGFHGVEPSAMRASVSQTSVVTTGATSSTPYGFTTKAQADAIVTLLNEIRAALVEKGIIKGSQ